MLFAEFSQASICLHTGSFSTSLLPADLCQRAYLLALVAPPSAMRLGGYTQSGAPLELLAPPSHLLILAVLCLLPASLDEAGHSLGSLPVLGVIAGVDF